METIERFVSCIRIVEDERLDPTDPWVDASSCWLWLGAASASGHGCFWLHDEVVPAHRLAYQMFCGPIPSGHEVEQLCGENSCVRPSHLWTVV